MSYKQSQQGRGNYGSKPNFGSGNRTTPATGGNSSKEPILEKFMRPTKSGKAVAAFAVGEKDLVLPANTRVVISALTEKQIAGLTKAREKNGFQGAVPTHKLMVFAIEESK